jgi:murein peptide amidase A
LPNHLCHDYAALMARWRELAKRVGMRVNELCRVEGYRVIWLETPAARAGERSVYLSAGVHGDEPGATSGLLKWAEAHEAVLKAGAFLIFPCLNPVGLVANTRVDGRGLDLNRRFHVEDDPMCGAWRKVMQGRRVKVGVCLHEDYDAQGMYVYELSWLPKGWSGEVLRRIATRRLPVEGRRRIEGRAAEGGVIQRRRIPEGLPGMPEAIALYDMGCGVSLTFETPSEFALDDRVKAQAAFLKVVVGMARGW